MNLCLRRSLRSSILNNFRRFSTSVTEVSDADQVLYEDPEEVQAREAEIEKKRNISRLSAAHFNLLNDRVPYPEPKMLAHLTLKYNRKMYGKFGATSGVNPSLCWPTKKEMEERIEYESVAYPYTIPQMIQMATEKRQEERNKVLAREKDLAEKFAKLANWKKELHDKVAKKAKEAEAAKNKKERLVEEVRRHFGFKLDPRDERFQEMLAKREKEQKKAEKIAKREEREKTMLAKLQQKNAELSDTK